MQEFITPIQDNLAELYKKLDKQLSLNWIGFDIYYKDAYYSFYPPTTPKEQKLLNRDKKKFIRKLLKDTLKDVVDAIVDEFKPNWGNIISFDDAYLSKWEERMPGEVSESYDVAGETTDTKEKRLDTDSLHLFAQRKDLTPEMWQEFFTKKFGDVQAGDAAKEMYELKERLAVGSRERLKEKFPHLYDSKSQHAKIAGENSNG